MATTEPKSSGSGPTPREPEQKQSKDSKISWNDSSSEDMIISFNSYIDLIGKINI